MEHTKEIKDNAESVVMKYSKPIYKTFHHETPSSVEYMTAEDYLKFRKQRLQTKSNLSSQNDVNLSKVEFLTEEHIKLLDGVKPSDTDLSKILGIHELTLLKDGIVETDPIKISMIVEDSKEYEYSKVHDMSKSFGPKQSQ